MPDQVAAASTGTTWCWSRWRWSAPARSRWRPTGSSIGRSTPATPAPPQRELVTGAVSVRTAWIGAAVALGVFLVAAAALSPLCLALAPLALVPLVVYPYGKRFTTWPHALLGLAQMVAPVGAWLAVTGTLRRSGRRCWAWRSGLWIGGFDLIYACQDAEFDRAIGVRSVPARFGVARRAARRPRPRTW